MRGFPAPDRHCDPDGECVAVVTHIVIYLHYVFRLTARSATRHARTPGQEDTHRLSRATLKRLGRIDFTSPADEDVQHLAESCDIATFGRGLQDVHDESYRKAGKLDRTHFSANFCPELSGLMDVIRHNILEGHRGKGLRIELYKLNVYGESCSLQVSHPSFADLGITGPGSFFKAHKDTPRAKNNVASLVIVLPTRHEGGALVLRHEEKEFKFDSGELLSAVQAPSIAYAAFFGDIEHEVDRALGLRPLVNDGNAFLEKVNIFHLFDQDSRLVSTLALLLTRLAPSI